MTPNSVAPGSLFARRKAPGIFLEEKPVNPASVGFTCLMVAMAVAGIVLSII